MALAGRSSQAGGRRLLVLALVVTVVVVLLDASLKSRSPAAATSMSAERWVDRVVPIVGASDADASQLIALRTSGLGQPATTITATLGRIASDTAASYRTVAGLGSPLGAAGAPGLLQAALLTRSKAAAAIASSVTASLSAPTAPSGPSDPNVAALAAAYASLEVGDQAYQLCTAALPPALGATMPPSVWVADATQQAAPNLAAWVTSLRNGTSLTPVHQLAVQAVTTSPPPVGTTGGVQDIPPTKTIEVTAVVADTGNQPERNLTVTATLTPGAPGAPASAREFTSLTAGTATTITLPLTVPSGVPTTLTVTVTAAAGSPTPPATLSIGIEVAAPPPPSTSTTVPVPTTGRG